MATKFREIDEPDVPIPVRQLVVGSKIPCDMFIRDDNKPKVFFNKNILYTKASLFYALMIISRVTGDYDSELLKTFVKMLGGLE